MNSPGILQVENREENAIKLPFVMHKLNKSVSSAVLLSSNVPLSVKQEASPETIVTSTWRQKLLNNDTKLTASPITNRLQAVRIQEAVLPSMLQNSKSQRLLPLYDSTKPTTHQSSKPESVRGPTKIKSFLNVSQSTTDVYNTNRFITSYSHK